MTCYLQSGIQTQWNIRDGDFYENSCRAIPVNSFRKMIHLIFHLRGSEFDSQKTLRQAIHIIDKRYIAYDILSCKNHL